MRPTGIIKRQEWVIKICPFCCKKLGTTEYIKRKVLKICTCRHCKNVIDERNIVW